MKKIISAVLACILIIIIVSFTGCSSSDRYENSAASAASAAPAAAAPAAAPVAEQMAAGDAGFGSKIAMSTDVANESAMMDDAEPEMPDSPETGGVAGPTVAQAIDTRKIIKNVDMQIQTLTFDKGVIDIDALAESFGGYIQNSYVEGRDMYNERGTRTATFSIRVPAERLDAFVNSFGGNDFNVISKSHNSDDITENYYDSKARLDALKVQEKRLLSMLENAAELEYMLQVEKELMNVRYEIESLTSALKRMDSYVSMSTVNITLYEVIKFEPVENVPVTFGERISRAFGESWQNFSEFSQDFTVGLVVALPFLLLLAIIAFIVIFIIRKSGKKRALKRENLPPVHYPQQNIQNLHPVNIAAPSPPDAPTAPPSPQEPVDPDDNSDEPK